MTLALLGFSFKSVPVETREALALAGEQLAAHLRECRERAGLKELLALSTCNRVEYYFVPHGPEEASVAALLDLLQPRLPAGAPPLERVALRLNRQAAHTHLTRVACSLESMVVGEPQILGQVKEAFQMAAEQRLIGPVLGSLMPQVFRTAKRVRTETQIARFPVSISTMAVELASRIFDRLQDQAVLVVGAGEMAELALAQLLKAGVRQPLILNRTLSHAAALAERYQGTAAPLEDLPRCLPQADIVISSTGARGYVIQRELVRQAMRLRRGKPMFFIDIAVPRDVDPEVDSLSDVYCYDIDDLQDATQTNREEREREALAAQAIIEQELARSLERQQALAVVPTVKALRQHFSHVAGQELEKSLAQLRHLAPEDRTRVERMVRTLVNKLLHAPSTRLKRLPEGQEGQLYAQVLASLFDLSSGAESAAADSPAGEDAPSNVLHLPVGGSTPQA